MILEECVYSQISIHSRKGLFLGRSKSDQSRFIINYNYISVLYKIGTCKNTCAIGLDVFSHVYKKAGERRNNTWELWPQREGEAQLLSERFFGFQYTSLQVIND